MTKTQIRALVAQELAHKGISRSQYSWPKPGWCHVFVARHYLLKGNGVHQLHVPAGRSKRSILEELECLPRVGKPKAYIPVDVTGAMGETWKQLDIEDLISSRR